jgi:hypothetical protein
MATQAEPTKPIEVTPEVLEALRRGALDREWVDEHPEVLEPYRGQWVVIHNRRIVAHSPDAAEAARAAPAARYNGGLLEYVPAREATPAVHVYTPFVRL